MEIEVNSVTGKEGRESDWEEGGGREDLWKQT